MKPIRLAVLFAGVVSAHAQQLELNTALMKATFEVLGPAANGKGTSFGTAFLIGKQRTPDSVVAANVLVTAAHVLAGIRGDTATLLLRTPDGRGLYEPVELPLKIRENGRNLYTTHESADVAAMYVGLPIGSRIELLPMAALVDDQFLTEIDIHPGDEVFCLGFARPARTTRGFPVLRSGHLASYPLTPARIVKSWLYDATLAAGNSGGPVYFTFENRLIGGVSHMGVHQGILGLIGAESPAESLTQSVIVPAIFIRETINELPDN